jgi:hypothetical protein
MQRCLSLDGEGPKGSEAMRRNVVTSSFPPSMRLSVRGPNREGRGNPLVAASDRRRGRSENYVRHGRTIEWVNPEMSRVGADSLYLMPIEAWQIERARLWYRPSAGRDG